jgi:hypothetical protein
MYTTTFNWRNVMNFFMYKMLLITMLFAQEIKVSFGANESLCPITIADVIAYSKIDTYYRGREKYMGAAADIIRKKIINEGLLLNSVLELGPYLLPIVVGSDVMDRKPYLPGIKYLHDATKTPWPIKDKAYDLFIALQVWEHLCDRQGNYQKEAFREVMRISKMAILSFPYKWKGGGKTHMGIDEKVISEWTLGVKPAFTQIVSRRAIYFFIFDTKVQSK